MRYAQQPWDVGKTAWDGVKKKKKLKPESICTLWLPTSVDYWTHHHAFYWLAWKNAEQRKHQNRNTMQSVCCLTVRYGLNKAHKMDSSWSCKDYVRHWHMYKILPVRMEYQFVCRHIFRPLGTLFVSRSHSFSPTPPNVQLVCEELNTAIYTVLSCDSLALSTHLGVFVIG